MNPQSFLIVTDPENQGVHRTVTIVSATPAESLPHARSMIRKHFDKFARRQKHLGSSGAPGITYHVIPAVQTTTDGANEPAITAAAWKAATVVEMWDGITREPVGNTTLMKSACRLRKVS